MTQPVAKAVVGVGVRVLTLNQANKPVGSIVGIGAGAVGEQVAVGIPGVCDAVDLGQAIGDVIRVGACGFVGFFCESVTYRVIGIVEVRAVPVVSCGEAVEGIVGVIDRDFDLAHPSRNLHSYGRCKSRRRRHRPAGPHTARRL